MINGTVVGLQACISITLYPPGRAAVEIECIVDTGFEGFLTLPPAVVSDLNLPYIAPIDANLADNSRVVTNVHQGIILWNGVERVIPVLAMGRRPLIGTALLEDCHLSIDFCEGGTMLVEKSCELAERRSGNTVQFPDEYALTLDSLSVALQNSYGNLKEASLSREDLDYSRLLVNRLRAFYCVQDKIKKFLDKQVAQAGADFFVEATLFSLKLFNEVEGLKLEVASERAIQRKRKAIRPDISIWREDALLAAIECKTQLGWRRHDWASHFDEREQKLKEAFPDAKMFLLVMTSCNWSGFRNDPRSGKQLVCVLKDCWPTQISQIFDPSILETPIERLLDQVECL